MAERTAVAELKDNQRASIDLLVQDKSLKTTRNGQAFLTVNLMDSSGTIEGKIWDEAEAMNELFQAGDVLQVEGRVGSYRGQAQINISSLTKLDRAEVNPTRYLPSSKRPIDEMLAELKALAAGLADPLNRLALNVLEDEELAPRLPFAPAAKMAHHAWVGGLLEHTLSVAGMASKIADHYPRLHRDILLTGAILHDLGKAFELDPGLGFGYTTSGRLIGHITMGAELVKRNAPEDMAPELLDEIIHLVVAHHGTREFGSPQLPHTLEAVALNQADDLDAKMFGMGSWLDKTEGDWTEFVRIYERHLFKGSEARPEQTENPGKDPAPKKEVAPNKSGAPKKAQVEEKKEAEREEEEGPGLFS